MSEELDVNVSMSEDRPSRESRESRRRSPWPSDEDPKIREIKTVIDAHYGPNLKFTRVNSVSTDLSDGEIYYSEFENRTDEEDGFCYVFKTEKGFDVAGDGVELLKKITAKLEAKKNIVQRMKDFDLNDMMGAAIGLIMVTSMMIWGLTKGEINKDVLSIVTLITGYYYGKSSR